MGGGVCIKNKYNLKIFTDTDTIECSGLYSVVDDYFLFQDKRSKYKCNFNKALLIKEDNEYMLHFDFYEPSAYIYLIEEDKKIDLPIAVKKLDISEEQFYVEYTTDEESIIKVMINIKR